MIRRLPETPLPAALCFHWLLLPLVLACSDTGSGIEGVAAVTISPRAAAIVVGRTVELTATPVDKGGSPLTGRPIIWSTSHAATATVSPEGRVTAHAAGPPVTISATSEGKHAAATVTVVDIVLTGITDVDAFIDRCPTLDPAYALIRQQFEIRSEGVLVTGEIRCTEPFSTQPAAQISEELMVLQVLRTAYYLSQGTAGKLPWTSKPLWDWMTSNVAGINLKPAPGSAYCCDLIDGKRYISKARMQGLAEGDPFRSWLGISALVTLYAHEARHAEPGGYRHVVGCAAIPPGATTGCDSTYDLANLGAYGIQYWFHSNWATGFLNVGFACMPSARMLDLISWHVGAANPLRNRFVTNRPGAVIRSEPIGGHCLTH